MITRENIIERLAKKYPQYSFIPTDVTKNGDVRLQGISVRNNRPISPIIYTNEIIEQSSSIDEAVEIISNIIEQHQTPDIDINMLQDRDFILDRIRIGVQKESAEELVKRAVEDFDGMEAYLYFTEHGKNHDMWSVKVRPELLKATSIDEEEAWQIAKEHTFAATTLQSMTEVLAEMMGEAFDPCLAEMTPCEMYVLSNKEKYKGAAGILDHDLLQSFASEHNAKALCILPSSQAEVILVPLKAEYNIDDFTAMVREVNATQVAPEDILADRAYVITFE